MNSQLFRIFICTLFIASCQIIHSMEESSPKERLEQTQERKISLKKQYPNSLKIKRSENEYQIVYTADGVAADGAMDSFSLSKLKNTTQFYPFGGTVTRCYNGQGAAGEQSLDIIDLGTTARYWEECKKIYETQIARDNKE